MARGLERTSERDGMDKVDSDYKDLFVYDMDVLTKLAIKYGTDKWGKHYTPYYYNLYRNKSKRRNVRKVLEIGVGEGAGLRTFRDFFPNAVIYGAEIADDRIFEEDRIKVYKCDQSKAVDLIRLLQKTGRDIDLVVEDGSHKPFDQVVTCLEILPDLERGTTYVIEDVADIRVFKEIKKYYSQAELVRLGKRYDDQLVIIKKI